MALSDYMKDSAIGSLLGVAQKEKWQIVYDEGGGVALELTSFLGMEVIDEGKVVSVPVEEGSFASYNKVETPLEVKIAGAIQGQDGDLQGALETLDELRASTELLNVFTPVSTLVNLTLQKYDYSLTRENGRGVLYVELAFQQVKQVESAYTDEKLAPVQDRGQTQTQKAEIKKAEPAAKPGSGYRKKQDKMESMASKIGLGRLTGLGRG